MSGTEATASPAKRRDDDAGLPFAVLLAALAGWVDAIGFIHWHGLFVSFMSGNTTKAAVGVGIDWPRTIDAARAILVFVVGVVLGELMGLLVPWWGRVLALAGEALLLWLAAAGDHLGFGEAVVASCLGLAMGLQNTSVHHADGFTIAVTYVTGTLVNIGRAVARTIAGKGRWSAALPYVALWLGLLVGGVGGAITARWSEDVAMAAAAVAASIFMIWTFARAVRGPAGVDGVV